MNKPELLLPANNLLTLKTAFRYGADAVYVGSNNFSLRSTSNDFDIESIKEAVGIANNLGKKLYVAINIYPRDDMINDIISYLKKMDELKVHGLIIADLGIVKLSKKYAPNIDIHISTQANNTNYMTYMFYYEMGIKRVVSARELSIDEIKNIKLKIPSDMEIESFIHGAMCISYSGRCLLSNSLVKKDANLGECTHPCRWKYALVEETRPSEYMPIMEDDKGSYIMNSKDLCMIEHIDKLVDAGIDSFKIEGRMKNALYIATCARTYRKAIDDFFDDQGIYNNNKAAYKDEISKCVNRSFTTGFYLKQPDENDINRDKNTYNKEYVYIGLIDEIETIEGKKYAKIIQKNKFSIDDEIEIIKPDFTNIKIKVKSILDKDYKSINSCPHPKEVIYFEIDDKDITIGDIIRMKSK